MINPSPVPLSTIVKNTALLLPGTAGFFTFDSFGKRIPRGDKFWTMVIGHESRPCLVLDDNAKSYIYRDFNFRGYETVIRETISSFDFSRLKLRRCASGVPTSKYCLVTGSLIYGDYFIDNNDYTMNKKYFLFNEDTDDIMDSLFEVKKYRLIAPTINVYIGKDELVMFKLTR